MRIYLPLSECIRTYHGIYASPHRKLTPPALTRLQARDLSPLKFSWVFLMAYSAVGMRADFQRPINAHVKEKISYNPYKHVLINRPTIRFISSALAEV